MYQYQASVTRVIDGDTFIADLDLGFDVWLRGRRFRLYKISAPELGEPGGHEAKAELAARLEGKRIQITTVKDRTDKYGRYLAILDSNP